MKINLIFYCLNEKEELMLRKVYKITYMIFCMKQIRAVAYDLEGTIINLEPTHHEAHMTAAR